MWWGSCSSQTQQSTAMAIMGWSRSKVVLWAAKPTESLEDWCPECYWFALRRCKEGQSWSFHPPGAGLAAGAALWCFSLLLLERTGEREMIQARRMFCAAGWRLSARCLFLSHFGILPAEFWQVWGCSPSQQGSASVHSYLCWPGSFSRHGRNWFWRKQNCCLLQLIALSRLVSVWSASCGGESGS